MQLMESPVIGPSGSPLIGTSGSPAIDTNCCCGGVVVYSCSSFYADYLADLYDVQLDLDFTTGSGGPCDTNPCSTFSGSYLLSRGLDCGGQLGWSYVFPDGAVPCTNGFSWFASVYLRYVCNIDTLSLYAGLSYFTFGSTRCDYWTHESPLISLPSDISVVTLSPASGVFCSGSGTAEARFAL